ncbi:uncharacterized protein LOC131029085 [Cryptomeria japonica]|uniref:uncharacterized protein LOC131029085 n=1 Tax=Cryptomeria japonica TaxID=3369 RepID=UPI0027D9F5D6|nr:uncharacterized protein LOC131029085 [Cryptomeria japonica]
MSVPHLRYTLSSRYIGALCSTEVGSSSHDPSTAEAQPHIPLASGLFDGASHVRLHPSVTLAAHDTPYDLTTTTFLVRDSEPLRTTEHGRMEGGDTDTAHTHDGASQDHVQQDDSSQPPSCGVKRTADEMHKSS